MRTLYLLLFLSDILLEVRRSSAIIMVPAITVSWKICSKRACDWLEYGGLDFSCSLRWLQHRLQNCLWDMTQNYLRWQDTDSGYILSVFWSMDSIFMDQHSLQHWTMEWFRLRSHFFEHYYSRWRQFWYCLYSLEWTESGVPLQWQSFVHFLWQLHFLSDSERNIIICKNTSIRYSWICKKI